MHFNDKIGQNFSNKLKRSKIGTKLVVYNGRKLYGLGDGGLGGLGDGKFGGLEVWGIASPKRDVM